MKKIFLPGLTAGAVMLIVGLGFGQIFHLFFPGLQAEYNNPALFRPWSDPLMSIYFLAPFILGPVLAAIWDKTKGLFKGSVGQRGTHFGLYYWLVTISGMVITYSTFQLSLLIVVSWSLSCLIQAICGGIILARMNK